MAVLDDRIGAQATIRRALYLTDAIFGDSIIMAGTSGSGLNGITQYMIPTGIVQNYVYQSIGETDDHDNPGIERHPDGKIVFAESAHSTLTSYSRVPLITNSAYMGPRVTAGTNDAYVRLWTPPTTAKEVIWFFRKDAATQRDQCYRVSTDLGASWGADTTLFAVTNQRPVFLDDDDDLDRKTRHHVIMEANPSEGTSNLWYFKSVIANDGTMTRYRKDGTQIMTALPIGTADCDLIWDAAGTGEQAVLHDVKVYNGVPVVVFATFQSSNTVHVYRRAVITSGAVTVTQIATGGTVTPHWIIAAEEYYSGGVNLDPQTMDRCYLGRKTSTATPPSVQMYQYDFAAGSWSQTANLSGDTGNINMRPYAITDGLGQTYLCYCRFSSYTAYTSFAGGAVIYKIGTGELSAGSYSPIAKPQTPVWQGSSYTPPGAALYCPLQERTGVPADFKPSGHTLSNVGSGPTWGSDSFGGYLTSFTTSNHLSMGDVQTINPTTSQTNCMWVMFSSSDATIGQCLISQGRSSSAIPVYSLIINDTSTGIVRGFVRDDANTTISLSSVSQANLNDGNVHVLMIVSTQGCMRLFFDDAIVALNVNTLGTTTFNRFRLGVLQRNSTATNPFLGKVYAFGCMTGNIPDPLKFIHDLKRGQFSAVRSIVDTRKYRRNRGRTLVRM